MSKKDTLFKKKQKNIQPFAFDKNTVEAFDDMIERSIPCYTEFQHLTASTALSSYQDGSNIYDCGCSTGNTIIKIFEEYESNKNKTEQPRIIALDKSEEMLGLAREKCSDFDIQWICDGIENISFQNASVIMASFVLQFIVPELRWKIISNMFQGLNRNGVLILSEKVRNPDTESEKIITGQYHAFKLRKGYSLLEIAQKDESLKTVLHLVNVDEYYRQLERAGFSRILVLFQYCNFVSILAIK